MNKLIAITGKMATGKTTLSHLILKNNPSFIYIDVDVFRRNLYKNENYISELKLYIPELEKYNKIDSNILNLYIYSNEKHMKIYKKVMYKYLINYINDFNDKTILVEWALILNDNLQDLFNKIIYLKASQEVILERLKSSGLSEKEILKRLELQQISNIEGYVDDNFMIIDSEGEVNMDKINSFINEMDCKFTLPNNEGKAIWEITHQCNYGCSYCMFSCNYLKVDGELTIEECFHVIDELVKNNFKHLKITGGEPFIRKDIIKILEYASKRLITDISTNASLITPEIVEDLNKLDLKMIHVSLDGNKEEHESVRGRNTYDKTIRGLQALKKSINKVRIGSVIHSNNEYSLENLIIDSINIEADEIIFSIMEPVLGQDRSLIKTISNDKLIDSLNKYKEKYKDKIIVNYNFGKQPNYVHICPGGDKFLYINNLGKVSPCPWVYENDKSLISEKSLKDKSLNTIMEDKNLVKFRKSKMSGKCYGKI